MDTPIVPITIGYEQWQEQWWNITYLHTSELIVKHRNISVMQLCYFTPLVDGNIYIPFIFSFIMLEILNGKGIINIMLYSKTLQYINNKNNI